MAGRVPGVLAVHPDAAPGGLADEHRQVEPGEQPRREGVGSRGHVDHDVLAGAVDEVVEPQLHRAGLRVVAGDADVGLVELTGDEVAHPLGGRRGVPSQHLVGRVEVEQPRSAPRRRRLDHCLCRRDARVDTAQVLLEPGKVGAERARRGPVVAQRRGEVLVDVGVDGDHRPPLRGEVAAERRRRRGLAAAALADERDAHGHPPVDRSASRNDNGCHL